MENNTTIYGGSYVWKRFLIIFSGYTESQSYVSYFKGKKEIEI